MTVEKREDEIHSENYREKQKLNREKQKLNREKQKLELFKKVNNIIPLIILVMMIISFIATFIMMDEVNNDLAILYIWASFTIVCLTLTAYMYTNKLR
jgi:hypothetical protein